MRLNKSEIAIIKNIINQNVKNAQIYIFGSRIDDTKKGGDIDILIIGDDYKNLRDIRKIKILLKEKLGEQKIDLMYQKKGELTPFTRLVKLGGVLL
jgi:predicted nucleotidyltransferase